MIFVLAIMALFIAMSIYFFFRAEKLQRELIVAKRESTSSRKEIKALLDSLALIANRYEVSAKTRLSVLKENESNAEQVKYLTPLVNNYSSIFFECLKGKGQLKITVQKCYNNNIEGENFKKFTVFIATQPLEIKRAWTSNSLTGFIALVEFLLLEKPLIDKNKSASNKTLNKVSA